MIAMLGNAIGYKSGLQKLILVVLICTMRYLNTSVIATF